CRVVRSQENEAAPEALGAPRERVGEVAPREPFVAAPVHRAVDPDLVAGAPGSPCVGRQDAGGARGEGAPYLAGGGAEDGPGGPRRTTASPSSATSTKPKRARERAGPSAAAVSPRTASGPTTARPAGEEAARTRESARRRTRSENSGDSPQAGGRRRSIPTPR